MVHRLTVSRRIAPMFQDLQVLCFDLDDTFWDVQDVLARAERAVLGFLAARYPRLAAGQSRESLMLRRQALVREAPERAHDLTWLRTESMRRLALENGCPPCVGDEAFEVFIAVRNDVRLYDDVLPALEHLGRSFTLATLSNGNADLGRIGLAERFSLSLSAGQLGVAKPDARAFAALAEALGVPPAAIAYVGDDPRNDVEGARGAGLRTVWVNRHGRPWPAAHAPADVAVRDLAELVAAAQSR
jgi:putative hydrolase of the HAD superfamily